MNSIKLIVVLLCVLNVYANEIKDEERILLNVITTYNPPWVQTVDENGDRFEGYAIDILHEIEKKVSLKFNITLAKSESYGKRDANGNFDGMIGEVERGEADMAIGDITITADREKAVAFSQPIAQTNIGLLVKRTPNYVHTEMGSEKLKPMVVYPVSSIDDLPKQQVVKFGAVRRGSTEQFFKNSNYPLYKKIGELMKDEDMSTNGVHGAVRVDESDGKYAFFMEGTAIEYVTSKDCDFMKLGDINVSRLFGIAMRKNLEHKRQINSALSKIQEAGIMTTLKNKWFGRPLSCHTDVPKVYKRQILNLVMNGLK